MNARESKIIEDMKLLEDSPRIRGYIWALLHEPHTEYNDLTSFAVFQETCVKGTELESSIPGDEEFQYQWELWERGVFDAKVFLRDDAMLGVADIVERTGMERSYIQAELKRGTLKGMKVGNSYSVYPDDFRTWLNNPKRGSRTKKSARP